MPWVGKRFPAVFGAAPQAPPHPCSHGSGLVPYGMRSCGFSGRRVSGPKRSRCPNSWRGSTSVNPRASRCSWTKSSL